MQGCIALIVLQPSPLVGGDSRNDLAVVTPYRAKTAAHTTLLVLCLGLVLQHLCKNTPGAQKLSTWLAEKLATVHNLTC